MGDRVNNMGKMMNNPKQRNMYIIIVSAAVLTIGAGVYFASKNTGPKASSGATVVAVPQINSTPGGSDNPQYNKSIKEANDKAAQAALDKNGSFVPTLTSGKSLSDKSPLDEIDREKQRKDEEARVKAEEEKVKAEQDIARLQEQKLREDALRQSTAPTTQVIVQSQGTAPAKHNKYGPEDYLLISSLTTAWHAKGSNAEYDFAKSQPTAGTNNGNGSNATATSANPVSQVPTKDETIPYAKAGTIFNAILETAINSDEPSPVLAKIVSGDLKGTRLIGQLQTVGDKVVIQFSTANIPELNSSVKLSAFAVDPNTSRTALADNVNHHYFLKYGVMLGASFLGGFADAIAHQNTTTTVSPFGGATVTQGELTTSQINKSALGSVGKAISTDAQQNFQNLKPTITVNSGSAIGILLVDDMVVKN